MAYPTSLDSFNDPQASDKLNSPSHSALHQANNTAIEALEAKVGVNSSVINTTSEFKLSEITGGDKAVGKTATQTLTNKTLTTATLSTPQINEAINMTASSTELNFNDGSISGTAVASKSLVLGATKNTDVLVIDNAIKFNAQQGFMINGKLSVTVATSDLTVAIKTLAGNDPSASDPVYIRIGNTVRAIISALSVTKNDGTNWADLGGVELATQDTDLFAYAVWLSASSAVGLGWSRRADGITYADFSGTTTNSSYLASSTIPSASDEVELIGRFNATLSAGGSHLWSIPATAIVINRPIFETRIMSWQPDYTGFSVNPLGIHLWQVSYKNIRFVIKHTTSGTSNTTGFTLTSPYATKTITNFAVLHPAQITDNGVSTANAGCLNISTGTKVITVQQSYTVNTWTNSGSKRVNNTSWGSYEY